MPLLATVGLVPFGSTELRLCGRSPSFQGIRNFPVDGLPFLVFRRRITIFGIPAKGSCVKSSSLPSQPHRRGEKEMAGFHDQLAVLRERLSTRLIEPKANRSGKGVAIVSRLPAHSAIQSDLRLLCWYLLSEAARELL